MNESTLIGTHGGAIPRTITQQQQWVDFHRSILISKSIICTLAFLRVLLSVLEPSARDVIRRMAYNGWYTSFCERNLWVFVLYDRNFWRPKWIQRGHVWVTTKNFKASVVSFEEWSRRLLQAPTTASLNSCMISIYFFSMETKSIMLEIMVWDPIYSNNFIFSSSFLYQGTLTMTFHPMFVLRFIGSNSDFKLNQLAGTSESCKIPF